MHRSLSRLHRIVLVVDGRRGTGEIVDFVDLHVEREGNVVAQELEPQMIVQMVDVALRSSKEIVGADHFVPLVKKPVYEMRAEEPRAPRHQNALAAVVEAGHFLQTPELLWVIFVAAPRCRIGGVQEPSGAIALFAGSVGA